MARLQSQASQVEQVGQALVTLGFAFPELVVLDPDVAASTKTSYFAERFPERFISVGISEQDMISIAAGLAASGKIALACGFAQFVVGRAWEQIANSIARDKLNVKIVCTHSGLSPSADDDSHQSFGDVSLMRVLPNMVVVVPADAPAAVEALSAVLKMQDPAYIRLIRGSSLIVYDEGCNFTLGRVNLLKDGSDATIIANGVMVSVALRAADMLSNEGLSVRVLDMHTVKPLDYPSLREAAAETGAIVTVEEHSIIGGLGGAVAETLAGIRPTPMTMIGIPDRFGESSRSYSELQAKLGLTDETVAKAVKEIMVRRN